MNSPDPFGLWEAPAAERASGLSFSAGAAPGSLPPPASLWSIDLSSGEAELNRREQQLAVIEAGLDEASARLDAFLASKGETGRQLVYDQGGSAEGRLLLALAEKDPQQFLPPGGLSYGLRDRVDWAGMGKKFTAFKHMVEQQLLHYVWVQTLESEKIIALTSINWGSDLQGYLKAGRPTSRQITDHNRSVQLAIRSRSGNVRMLVRITSMAMRIAAALTNPISALDALSLAWQFLQDIILPMLKQSETGKA